MRILWADDQIDVARTLSLCIGGAREHKIVFVADGEQALSRVNEAFFDFAVVDLGMPPGHWGGLWLLEQLKQKNCRLPVLVLSGEGKQPETIQALRIGARDYVTKELAATDLRVRIAAVLDNLWAEIHKKILTSFPTVLAVPYKRHLSSTAPQSQMRTLIDIYENALRLAGIVGFAELNPEQAAAIPRNSFAQLSHPSMGTWNELCRSLTKVLPRESAARSLFRTFDEKNINEIIKTRNDIAHGYELSELNARSWLESQDAALRTWLSRLWQHLQLRIFFVVGSEYDGHVMLNDARALEGESQVLPKFILRSRQPLVARKAYLLPCSHSTENILAIDPFVLLQPGRELNSWRSFLLDGWNSNRAAAPSGDESLRYLEVWSGSRSDDLGQRLKAIPEIFWIR